MSDGDVQEPQQTVDEPRRRSRRFVGGHGRDRRLRGRHRPSRPGGRHLVLLVLRQLPLHEAGVPQLAARRRTRPSRASECHIPPGAVAAVKWRTTEARNIWAHLPQHEAREGQPAAPGQRELRSSATRSRASWASRARSACRTPGTSTRTTSSASTATTTRRTRRPERAARSAWPPAPCATSRPATPTAATSATTRRPSSGKSHPTDFLDGARQARPRQRAGLPALSPQQERVLRRLPREAHAGPLLGQLAATRTASRPRRTATAASAATLRSSCATSVTPWTTRPTGRRRTRRWPPRAMRSCLVCHPTQMCDRLPRGRGSEHAVTTQ